MVLASSPPNSIIHQVSTEDALKRFLEIPKHHYFEWCLTKSFPPLYLESTTQQIQRFVDFDCGRKDKEGKSLITPGGRHSYFRAIRCFYNWAYSPASGLGFEPSKNPVTWVVAPVVPRRKMPAQNEKTIEILLSIAGNTRNKALISTFIDTSGRLSEVTNIRETDIIWDKHVIKAICKGNREALMPMGPVTENLIREWLAEYHPPDGGNIWGLTKDGIVIMLRRLEKRAGFKCNAHTFRRGFACIQRRNKVDTLDIKTLGHWLSYRMVEHYTEDVDLEDAQKHYIPPTSQLNGGNGNNGSKENQPSVKNGHNGDYALALMHLAEEIGALKERMNQLEEALK